MVQKKNKSRKTLKRKVTRGGVLASLGQVVYNSARNLVGLQNQNQYCCRNSAGDDCEYSENIIGCNNFFGKKYRYVCNEPKIVLDMFDKPQSTMFDNKTYYLLEKDPHVYFNDEFVNKLRDNKTYVYGSNSQGIVGWWILANDRSIKVGKRGQPDVNCKYGYSTLSNISRVRPVTGLLEVYNRYGRSYKIAANGQAANGQAANGQAANGQAANGQPVNAGVATSNSQQIQHAIPVAAIVEEPQRKIWGNGKKRHSRKTQKKKKN